MFKKRLISFVPIIGIACLLCSCTVDINAEEFYDFAETKNLSFYLDDDTYYFPTERLDTIYYDDLNEIDASSLSIHDIVVITNIDNTYVFSDSDISGINTMFEQGAMVIFINFHDSFYVKYRSDFAAMGISFQYKHDLGLLGIFSLCNEEMQNSSYWIGSITDPQDNTDISWELITDSVVDMYEMLEYVR